MLKDIKLTNDPLLPEMIREITIAPPDDSVDLPAITITGAYLKRDTFRAILKPIMGKQELDDRDETKYRSAVVQRSWRGWSGVTLRNLARVSEYVLLNYEALKEAFAGRDADENTPIAFDIEDAKWVATKLNNETFVKLVEELCRMDAYAAERLAQEKKD